MILRRAQGHEVKEVFVVGSGDLDRVLLENGHELLVGHEIGSPAVHLSFAFKSETVQLLRINVVPL